LGSQKGTPRDVIVTLNTAAVDLFADPTLRTRFAELALERFPHEQQMPEALAAFQKAEIET
jgi:hypothetical protein